MNKKYYIILVILLTLALSTKAIANLTLGTTSVTSSGALTLSTNSSTLVLPTTNGTNGQVLTTNGAGTTSWSTVGGGGVTNSALANVIPKSDGANLVGSRISDDGANIISLSQNDTTKINLTSDDGGTIYLGDAVGNGSGTFIGISDPQTQITLQSSGLIKAQTIGTFCAGDCDGNANGVKIIIDDSAGISLDPLGAGEVMVGGNVRPFTAASGTLGSTTFPFSDLYVGNAASNSSRITGIFAGNRVATLPDRTGTLKVGVDYKVYTALLTQSGTSAPTAAVLENTLGEVPTFLYDDTGNYYLSIVSPLFSASKTFAIMRYNTQGEHQVNLTRESPTTYRIHTDGDGVLLNEPLEIRVYP